MDLYHIGYILLPWTSDRPLRSVSARSGPIEVLPHAVNRSACDVTFALDRDFPDAHRESGGEQF